MRTIMKKSGVALVATLLVMLIVMVMAVGFVFFTVNDMVVSKNIIDAVTTLNLAEAGIDYAIFLAKHNMTMYPGTYAGVTNDVSDFPAGYAVYNAAYYGSSSQIYYNGQIIKLNQTAGAGQEHVVVSSLSYGGDNYLSEGNHCGTFELRISSTSDTGTKRNIVFESIGRVRAIPARFTGTPDWTTMKDGTWTEKARRTVYAQITLQSDSSQNQGSELFIKTYYEKFR